VTDGILPDKTGAVYDEAQKIVGIKYSYNSNTECPYGKKD